MAEENIEMKFTKKGIFIKEEVKTVTGIDKHEQELDYDFLSSKNIANIESVKPIIEDGELKSLIFQGKDIKIENGDDGENNEETKIENGIIIKGESYESDIANRLLVNSANWLIENGYLSKEDLPIDYGGSERWLINDENKQKGGGKFGHPKKLENGWWIETKFSTKDCKKYTKWLLKENGLNEGEFEIKGF